MLDSTGHSIHVEEGKAAFQGLKGQKSSRLGLCALPGADTGAGIALRFLPKGREGRGSTKAVSEV